MIARLVFTAHRLGARYGAAQERQRNMGLIDEALDTAGRNVGLRRENAELRRQVDEQSRILAGYEETAGRATDAPTGLDERRDRRTHEGG
ncbi:MAG: hypothetical protein ACRDMV_25180 [Streptosporangiales bacterium]